MVGLQWLHLHPTDFRSAVFVNTSLRGLSPLFHRLKPRVYMRMLRAIFTKSIEREKIILEITSSSPQFHPELAERWAEIQALRPVSRGNAFRQLWEAATFHPPALKPDTKIMLLNGAGDQLVSQLCSERIASHWQIPLRTHPSAGHDLPLDAPDWMLEQLKQLL